MYSTVASVAILVLTAFVLSLSYFVTRADYLRRAAVRGSLERYVATTWCIVLQGVLALVHFGFVVWSVHHIIQGVFVPGWTILGLAHLALMVWRIYSIWRLLKSDDNWFNRQGKKLRTHLKNLRSRLTVRPAGLPMPT